jgi:hypothetical protein
MIFFGKPVPTFPDHALASPERHLGSRRRNRRDIIRPDPRINLVQNNTMRQGYADNGTRQEDTFQH